jgi:putative ABC transport system permease protein
MNDARPPAIVTWLIERTLPREAADAAIGDLDEEFAALSRTISPSAARRWYWRQACSLSSAYVRNRWTRDRASGSGRVSRMDLMRQDVRYALRALRRSASFTIVALLMLALGIGATSAIFSFVDGVLLRPLPYRDPGSIVRVWERPPGATRNGISTMNFRDWQDQNTVFSAMAAASNAGSTLSGAGGPLQIRGARVSAAYFDIYGARPASGRTFAAGEDTPGHDRVVVISHALWQEQFAGDPSIVGRAIVLDGIPYAVIGIMPADSPFDRGWARLWRPLTFAPGEQTRDYHWLIAVARLKPGVTFEQAQANMDAIGARIAHDYPHSNKDWGVHLDRLADVVVGDDLKQSLKILLGAVGLLLLLGCANLANLSLARGTNREREVVVRAALGASRSRILRQFLTESLILSVAGGALGIAVGYLMMRGLEQLLPPLYLPREAFVTLDWHALVFSAAIAILTGVLFGVAPAFHASRIDLSSSMRASSRSATGDRSRRRLRHSLVVAEIAISCVLLAGAGLLGRSFFAMRGVEAARDPDHVLVAGLFAPAGRFGNPDEARVFYRRIYERVSAIPGVTATALASAVPLEGWSDGMPLTIAESRKTGGAGFKEITPSYFATVGLAIVRGRGLTGADRKGSPPAIVVNEQFAEQFFPGGDPIGVHLLIQEIIPGQRALGPEIPWEVVGVVQNEHAGGLGDHDGAGLYVSMEQGPAYGPSVVLRTAVDAMAIAEPLRAAIKSIDPGQAVTNVRSVSSMEDDYVAPDRLRTSLIAAFGAIALLLAAVGIYGVMAYSVEQRTHEIGIRAALGAGRGALVGLVMRQATVLVGLGVALGIGAALAMGRILSSLLFGVTPRDPVTLIAAAVTLALTALAAAWVPARRAAAVDPIRALRVE